MEKNQPVKTKYTAFVASSIDGRIAKNSKSGIDWTSKEDWNFLQKSLANTDAVIVGHNTYKIYESRLKKRNTVVLTSKTVKPRLFGSVFFLNPKKINLRNFLQSKNYKNVSILGGARVYAFCLKHKMLDELFVTIEPYVFTNGIAMFTGDSFKKYQFLLQSVQKINKKGTILLKYKNEN